VATIDFVLLRICGPFSLATVTPTCTDTSTTCGAPPRARQQIDDAPTSCCGRS